MANDVSYTGSLVRYVELSENRLSREPFTGGSVYVTDTGRFYFDSPVHNERVQLNGNIILTDATDFDTLDKCGSYIIENVNGANSPLQAKGTLQVNRGNTVITQTFTTIGGKVYVRGGSIAVGFIDWSTWKECSLNG